MLKLRNRLRQYDLRPFLHHLVHPGRRYLARRSLSESGVTGPVLFVCFGNICRSPYAAAVLRAKLESRHPGVQIDVTSAGFAQSGRPCPGGALTVATERGVDLQSHISRQLNRDMVNAAEWVFVMDPLQASGISGRFGKSRSRVVVLGDLDPVSTGAREVEDPWNKPHEVFRRSYDRIDRCVGALLGLIPTPRPRHVAEGSGGVPVPADREEVTAESVVAPSFR